MRSKTLFVVLTAVLGAGLTACATQADKTTCYPVLGWTSPVFHCAAAAPVAVAPPPAPEPAAPPPPEPAPEPKPTATVGAEKIELSETVQFETDSAVLVDRSKKLLDEVVTVINDNPDLKRLVIEGHTDSNASHAHNQKLSEQRVEAVKAYLVEKGVDAKKLKTKAFGETKPIADNKTEDGRAKNRRVDFRIVERKKK
ncbi:MAG TPA: OmpA family protein [Kofleriaceae bacterium]|jgi:OOP family OmpA-OmpF porin|nr:OmpA family protein [Kofleriaceae bacterium]